MRIGIATDLGYIPESVKFHLRRTDLLLLEANHDLDMLKVGPYPWSVKQRVMSRVGHLSNLGMSELPVRGSGLLHGAPGAGPPERAEQSSGDRAAWWPARRWSSAAWRRGCPSPRNAAVGSFSILITTMIARYTRPEMGRIWSDQNKFQQWLEVELAASEALAELGVVPAEAARLLRAHAGFDVARILEIEKRGEARRDRLHHRGGRDHGRAPGTPRPRAGCTTA